MELYVKCPNCGEFHKVWSTTLICGCSCKCCFSVEENKATEKDIEYIESLRSKKPISPKRL